MKEILDLEINSLKLKKDVLRMKEFEELPMDEYEMAVVYIDNSLNLAKEMMRNSNALTEILNRANARKYRKLAEGLENGKKEEIE